MKNLFYSRQKAKEEAEEKARIEQESREEREYLSVLVKDELFQKYIIQKRIKQPVALLDTIQNLPSTNLDVEVQVRKGTVKALKDIFNSLIV